MCTHVNRRRVHAVSARERERVPIRAQRRPISFIKIENVVLERPRSRSATVFRGARKTNTETHTKPVGKWLNLIGIVCMCKYFVLIGLPMPSRRRRSSRRAKENPNAESWSKLFPFHRAMLGAARRECQPANYRPRSPILGFHVAGTGENVLPFCFTFFSLSLSFHRNFK